MAAPVRRYELLERIAKGGMGEVFRAQVSGEHGFSKPVAVKRILPEQARDPEFVMRLVAEAKTMVALSHTNIVQVFDLCRADDELLIVMELVEGADLGVLLLEQARRRKPLPISIVLYLAMEALKALHYAHSRGRGVVHCDISPSNLLVSFAGEVKITDFGIAQSMSRNQGRDREVMGKLRYMSPERLRGDPIEPGTDLYALAVVMWETIAMRPLFKNSAAPDTEEIKETVRREVPQRLDVLRDDVGIALADIIARGLSKHPEERPRSAAALLSTLTQIAHAQGTPPTAPEVGAWVSALVKRAREQPARRTLTGFRAVEEAGSMPIENDATAPTPPAVTRDLRAESQPVEGLAERPRTLTFAGERSSDGFLLLDEIKPRRALRTWLLVAGVAAVVAIAGVQLRQQRKPEEPAAKVAARAPTEPAAPQPTPPVAPAAPLAAPTVGPASDHIVRRPTEIASGFLNVSSEPWAEVWVDGKSAGTTPILRYKVSAGEHRIKLRNPDLPPVTRRVRVAAGKVELVSVELSPP